MPNDRHQFPIPTALAQLIKRALMAREGGHLEPSHPTAIAVMPSLLNSLLS